MTLLIEEGQDYFGFQCHSYILSYHSPRFRGMISSLWQQNLPMQISLTEHDPDIVKNMLEFIYTGKCDAHTLLVCELMLLADWLGIQDLRDQCLIVMGKTLHPFIIQQFVSALISIQLVPTDFVHECLRSMCHPAVLKYVIHTPDFCQLEDHEIKLILVYSRTCGITPLLLQQAIKRCVDHDDTRQESLHTLYVCAQLQQRSSSE